MCSGNKMVSHFIKHSIIPFFLLDHSRSSRAFPFIPVIHEHIQPIGEESREILETLAVFLVKSSLRVLNTLLPLKAFQDCCGFPSSAYNMFPA